MVAHLDLLRDVAGPFDCREVKSLGDGLMVAFASPSEAVSCAVAMQLAVLRRDPDTTLRVGIHSGEVTVDGEDYFGPAVVLAQRLCAQADAGQILVSDVV